MQEQMPDFKRRDGYSWNSNLYQSLLNVLLSSDMGSLSRLKNITITDAKVLAQKMGLKYGKYKNYYENLHDFVAQNCEIILDDMNHQNNNLTIIAPLLREWLEYKKSLIMALQKCKSETLKSYIQNIEFKFSKEDKIQFLNQIYNVQCDKFERGIMKKLDNALYLRRKEIVCDLTNCNVLNELSNLDPVNVSTDCSQINCPGKTSLKLNVDNDYLREATQHLIIADDLATSIIIDIYHLRKKSHKINNNILGDLTDNIQFYNEIKAAINDFKLPLKKILDNLLSLINNTFEDVEIPIKTLKCQLQSYLKLIHPASGLVLKECSRFSKNVNQGVKICATKFYPKNTILNTLNGNTANLTERENEYLTEKKLDFSVFTGESQSSKIWLGPGAYVNHECQPNAKLYSRKSNGVLCLQTIRDIQDEEEITWNYGQHYFAPGECECSTCKIISDENQPPANVSAQLNLSEPSLVLERWSDSVAVNRSNCSNDSSLPRGSFSNLSENTINEILGTN